MNEQKGIRLWQWAVLLLVLCNIGLIVTIWLKPPQQQPQPSGPPPQGGGGPRDYVVRELKFTDEQTKKYDVLVHDHQQAMQRLRHDAMDLRKQLFANLKNEDQKNNFTDSLTRLIASNQKEIEMVTYNHFAQVRTICTDAQKKDFDNIIGEVIKKMNGGPGGHHPPPGDGHGPPPERREGDRPPPPGDDGPPPPPPPPGDR